MILGREKSENQYYLQGFEPDCHINQKRYIRLASLYPEEINYVEFYQDSRLLYTSFAEPFMLYSLTTWEQKPYVIPEDAKEFRVKIYLHNGEIIQKSVTLAELKK